MRRENRILIIAFLDLQTEIDFVTRGVRQAERRGELCAQGTDGRESRFNGCGSAGIVARVECFLVRHWHARRSLRDLPPGLRVDSGPQILTTRSGACPRRRTARFRPYPCCRAGCPPVDIRPGPVRPVHRRVPVTAATSPASLERTCDYCARRSRSRRKCGQAAGQSARCPLALERLTAGAGGVAGGVAATAPPRPPARPRPAGAPSGPPGPPPKPPVK